MLKLIKNETFPLILILFFSPPPLPFLLQQPVLANDLQSLYCGEIFNQYTVGERLSFRMSVTRDFLRRITRSYGQTIARDVSAALQQRLNTLEHFSTMNAEQKIHLLLSILNSHFTSFGNWNETFQNSQISGNWNSFLDYAETTLMTVNLSGHSNSRAIEILQGFQDYSQVFGFSNVQSRILGFLLVQNHEGLFTATEQTTRRSVQHALLGLRVDILNSDNTSPFSGFNPNHIQGSDNDREIGAVRPQIFQDDRGLPRYDIRPIDSTANQVAPPPAQPPQQPPGQ